MTNGLTTNALSDVELLEEVKRLTVAERQATAGLIAALGELDARRLYLGEGCSSLFAHGIQVLHLSEPAAAFHPGRRRGRDFRARVNGTRQTTAQNEARARRASASNVDAHRRRRDIPASVKRDQGRCAFVGSIGRCTERGCLEYHHRIPFSDGGATSPDNLELRCRAHNAFEAERWFGVREEDLAREARVAFD